LSHFFDLGHNEKHGRLLANQNAHSLCWLGLIREGLSIGLKSDSPMFSSYSGEIRSFQIDDELEQLEKLPHSGTITRFQRDEHKPIMRFARSMDVLVMSIL
jgi:hypothetical protein